MTTALSHVGVCVSDLEASTRFYCDALDFEQAESYCSDPDGRLELMEVPA